MDCRSWQMHAAWALRKVGRHYRRPPWELLDIPEDTIIAEAEYLDIEEELAALDNF